MLIKSLKLIFLYAFCMILLGCTAKATYTSLVSDKYETIDSEPEVFFSMPQKPTKFIGLLQADGYRGMTQPELIDALKMKAKQNGAHGIYLLSLQEIRTPQGIMYNPWLGGYQTVGGHNVPRAYALALRYKRPNNIADNEMNGRWMGYGVSTIVGEFKLAMTIHEINGGISGVVTTTHGFNGTFSGYIDGSSLEFLAVPSDLTRFCMTKFVGSIDKQDTILGQYSTMLCNVSEGGTVQIVRANALQGISD